MRNKYIYSLLCVGLLSVSCNDFLDTLPDSRTEVDSAEKITALLVSAYPTNTDRVMTEMASDNSADNGSEYTVEDKVQEEAYLWEDSGSTSNDSFQSYWDACYGAIAAANLAIESIEALGGEGLDAQMGEALMCRAYGHFALANTFCLAYNPDTADTDLGLVYMTESETELNPTYERISLGEYYELINADIEAGLPLIDDSNYSVPKYHFNQKAAYAFAARFNLYYLNYEKTIEYATKVLGTDPSLMMRDWPSIYTASSDWTIRTNMYVDVSEPSNLLLGTAVSSAGYWLGPYSLGKRYGHSRTICSAQSFYSTGPWGSYLYLCPGRSVWGYDQKMATTKVQGYFEYTDKVAGIGYRQIVPVLFTANETVLCRAEAYALLGDLDSAVTDINYWLAGITTSAKTTTLAAINTLYSGKEYTDIDNESLTIKNKLNPLGFTIEEGSDLENVIHCILHCRRVETIHEGHRWQDVKRYGIEISHNRENMANDYLYLDDPRRAMQLPQDVINAGLQANPRN